VIRVKLIELLIKFVDEVGVSTFLFQPDNNPALLCFQSGHRRIKTLTRRVREKFRLEPPWMMKKQHRVRKPLRVPGRREVLPHHYLLLLAAQFLWNARYGPKS
jgi:hypothetical protein